MSETSTFTKDLHDIDDAAGLPERIAALVDCFKTKSAAADIAGVDANTISRWIERGSMPNPRLRNLLPLIRHSGMSMDWLISGQGARFIGPEGFNAPGIGEQAATYSIVPLLDGHDSEDASYPVNNEELIRHHLTRQQLVAYVIDDNSMAPTLTSHDVVLVNHTRTLPSSAGIHMVEFKGEPMPRRLQRTLNGLTLLCDDPLLENIEIPEAAMNELVILGRIVWAGRWL